MDSAIILGLMQNTAILLAFSMIYDFSWIKHDKSVSLPGKIFHGIVIGAIGMVLMLTPWKQVAGVAFDTRSILLSLSGLFFGFIPTLVAVIITGSFRLAMGGAGVTMGIAVIISSAGIGILWRRLRPSRSANRHVTEFLYLGLAVHLGLLACAFFLPSSITRDTLKNISIPALTIYPAGTVLLGILMQRQYLNWKNRKASLQLKESERSFKEMLKNTLLYSLIIDAEGKVTFCNDSALRASGYSPEDLLGQNAIEKLVPPEYRDNIREKFLALVEGHSDYSNYETEVIRKDGSRIQVSYNATAFRDQNNKIIGIALIGENITARKNVETELINAKLRAEESDKLKSIFISNMSHEIRTPMNAIMGFSNLLGDKDLTITEKQHYVNIIRNAGDRLLQILNDIIDVSKLEAKQLTISMSECDLFELFSESIETFHNSGLLIQKPELTLKLNIREKDKGIKVICDYNRFQQVLDNLLSNAIKYSERGTIETGYTLVPGDDPKMIEVFVMDTGIGIPEKLHSLIFERFRQVEEGRFHEGAGLGLSISKGIVELLGGKIWFTSETNRGSTFYFSVPYKKPVTTIDTQPEVITSQKPDLKGKIVIVAEDDYNSFYYIRLLLEELGATILHAENGQVLMRHLHRKVPDLVLLDINMPVMSGFDCLHAMKETGISTLVIAQTAYAMPDEHERCMKSGCHGYITKPIKKSELHDLIFKVLSMN
jgi:hypothetical protein